MKAILTIISLVILLQLPCLAQRKLAKPIIDTTVVYSDCFVDTPPIFPGGEVELNKFLWKHLHWPVNDSVAGNFKGTFLVYFLVDRSGKASPYPIGTKNKQPFMIDLVKKMPLWTPAKKDGQFVNMEYCLRGCLEPQE
ncbi:hypothetical protein LX64_03807 [Chitinophaga skermanii]|uniref:TonB-like protein n=1 Tax=Chitinophaga skermanii TaxID=331697 RepID=A0A327QBD3_9BACT|nr:hypothetical protein [Chitinophaga skermanii]RAJ01591.1 hypothetical protein LX64_03807 [Chitinophaga skermanii]